jgi:hypothetical protein
VNSKEPHAGLISRGLGLCGRIASGKDFVADRLREAFPGTCGSFSFAEPLYALSKHFFGFGQDGRYVPGIREFWQKVGCWGRGSVPGEKLQASVERALFVGVVRTWVASEKLPAELMGNPDIWCDALVYRVSRFLESNAFSRRHSLAIATNVRFPNELAAFQKAGWPVYYVTCSEAARKTRQARQGLTFEAAGHASEGLAGQIENLLQDLIGRSTPTPSPSQWLEDNGIPIAGVIWNDQETDSPNPEYLSLRAACDLYENSL